MKRTRVIFNYENEQYKSHEKLEQIICSSHWGSKIDVLGIINENHTLLLNLVMKDVIVIDECEYELQEPYTDNENARLMKAMLGKRSNHPVLRDMAMLFDGEPFEASRHYRNTIYFPNLKSFTRADGMKPEDIAEMLSLDDCEKIIIFPYSPLDEKSAYYELTLGVPKKEFVDFINQVEKRKEDAMNEAIRQANERMKQITKLTPK